jgi:hypothetical protein
LAKKPSLFSQPSTSLFGANIQTQNLPAANEIKKDDDEVNQTSS